MNDLDRNSKLISALARLGRAGAEDSVQSRKLIEAAALLNEHIVVLLGEEEANLPWGFRLRYPNGVQAICVPDESEGPVPVYADRDAALQFAGAIAHGWLDELVGSLEYRNVETIVAIARLEVAVEVMR